MYYHLRGEYDSVTRDILLLGERHSSDFCSMSQIDKTRKRISVLDFIKTDIFRNIYNHDSTLHIFLESNYKKEFSKHYVKKGDSQLLKLRYYFDACNFTRKKECNLKRTQVHNVDYRDFLIYAYCELFGYGIKYKLYELQKQNTIAKNEIKNLKEKASLIIRNESFFNSLTLNQFLDFCCEIKAELNKVAKTNEKAFDLLANKFNESVEVILELTQRVEKLETVTKLQSMQESVKKTEVKSNSKGLKFFIFLLFVAGISYFFYKFDIDLSIIKDISRDFLGILGR